MIFFILFDFLSVFSSLSLSLSLSLFFFFFFFNVFPVVKFFFSNNTFLKVSASMLLLHVMSLHVCMLLVFNLQVNFF